MQYSYYPGCSLEGTAKEYDAATRAFLTAMGNELEELPDWTCCGATAAGAISRLLALALPARNLALGEKTAPGRDILVPCSACYLNLKRVEQALIHDPHLVSEINAVLAAEQLQLKHSGTVRHLLDVLVNDMGPQSLAARVVRPLTGIVVAPYYGCQCLRPYPVFDDPESPTSMEALLRAAGADILDWSMGPKCCGASNVSTKPAAGLELTAAILSAARPADVIATVCPMCQMNLEAFQRKISNKKHIDLAVSVLYLPQLLGLAIGLDTEAVGTNLNLALTGRFKAKLRDCRPDVAAVQ
jgi:heterodisulfide reductase subunit B